MPKGYDPIWVAVQLEIMLKSKLPAKLVELNTEYGDGITLIEPHTDSYEVGERALFPQQFPSVAILSGGDSNLFEDSGRGRYDIVDHHLVINITMSAEDSEMNMYHRTGRYIRALIEVCNENFTADDSTNVIYKCNPFSSRVGFLLSDGDALLQECQVNVRLGAINT